jgi:hypothetical protein
MPSADGIARAGPETEARRRSGRETKANPALATDIDNTARMRYCRIRRYAMIVKGNLDAARKIISEDSVHITERAHRLAEELGRYGFRGTLSLALTVAVNSSNDGVTFEHRIAIPFDRN